jgi:5'(3')-deoxyribonucleotidase
MERKRLIIDMDHVMADITSQYIKWYKDATGVEVAPHSLMGKGEAAAFPQPEKILDFLHSPGFFRTAGVIPGSREVIEALNEVYDVYIVSAAMQFPQSLFEKFEWLQEHFPFIGWQQIAFTGSKKPVTGDYMIDDHRKNLDHFNGTKLLYTAPHNIHITDFTRVNDWEDVRKLLLN